MGTNNNIILKLQHLQYEKVRAGAKSTESSQTCKKKKEKKKGTQLYLTLWKEALFTMGVMSVRVYCFRQPSELQPTARPLEELQMESITIYFDAWESLDIDLGWWQFPRSAEEISQGRLCLCCIRVSASCNKRREGTRRGTMLSLLCPDNQPS